MRRRKNDERIGWVHVAAAALGLLVTNLLIRVGLRRNNAQPPPTTVQWQRRPPNDAYDEPHVVDHTPVPPEPRDARLRPLLLFGVGLLLFFGFVQAIVSGLQWVQTGRLPSLLPPPAGADEAPDVLVPPDPRQDIPPRTELETIRATEAALLDYGWADQEAGVVRLPIERALELVAERGLPVAEGAEDRRYADLVPVLPLDSSSGHEGEKLWP